jgi:methanethiol oxidase
MVLLKPDPTFYPSARMAMEAPPETHAYVAMLNPNHSGRGDGLATVDLDGASDTYGQIVNILDLTIEGDELHHFGWNVCSAALVPTHRIRISNGVIWWYRG